MEAKRSVTYDGSTYKVRSDKVEIPDFASMSRTAVRQWMSHHTYGRGYSRPKPLAGLAGVIGLGVR